jgi:hypothetical protein
MSWQDRRHLYLVHTKSICEVDSVWRDEFSKTHMCPGLGCGAIIGLKSHGVNIWLRDKPDISAVNAIIIPGVNIARCDFLELFADEVQRYLFLGEVFVNGILCSNYVTFSGDKPLLIRGGAKSRFYGCCRMCGRIRYSPAYPWYVLKDYLLSDQPVYEAWNAGGLVLNEELKNRIQRGKWKGIYITKLPIIEQPNDGIVDLPYSNLGDAYHKR